MIYTVSGGTHSLTLRCVETGHYLGYLVVVVVLLVSRIIDRRIAPAATEPFLLHRLHHTRAYQLLWSLEASWSLAR